MIYLKTLVKSTIFFSWVGRESEFAQHTDLHNSAVTLANSPNV